MEKSDNEEREQRILDAAADLFVHYGYDKTTVDDIARQAGVSKGAIYLHFKSKDELFEGLLVRETMVYHEKWLQLIDADPKGGTIGGMYKNVLYALNSSPFMSAMFRRDGRVLGNYLRKPNNFFRRQNQSTRYEFVKMMQDAGAIRQDIDPKIIAHIMNMLAYGLVAMDEIMAAEFIPPADDVIEGIAEIMDRALTPDDGGNNEAGKAILRQISEAGRQQFEQMNNQNEREPKMISVKNLTYTYPGAKQETLHGLNFEVAEHEIFGFLGPSGAGKSTTQNILIGLLKDYGGTIQMMNRELNEWGQDYYEHIGVSFELPNHYLKLTALENLNHFRSLYSGPTLEPMDVLAWVGLQEDADKKVEDYSKGMKIRLNVARSIIHQPKVLFLDEPTSGLDPVNARKIKDLVLDLRRRGATVFVTTHNMMVADELCDRVAFITAGQISLIDAPPVLKKQYGQRKVQVEYLNGAQAVQHQEFPLDGLGDNEAFLNLLKSAPRVETIHTQETTLENIFIEVTGQELSP